MRSSILLSVLLSLATLSAVEAADPRPFERGTWAKLREAHAGRPTVVHFWAHTGAPCLAELPHWGEVQARRPDLRLVLIAADPVPQDPERLAATLARSGLDKTESWSFTDRFYERLRYEIDPAWAGELPRTVMIGRDGKVTVLTGVADLAQVRQWLDAQSKSH